MQGANTVHMQLYTPNGVRLNFVIGIQDGKLAETLPALADIENMIAEAGYLVTQPGLEPGEDAIEIGYVCRYIKFDEKNNREVSHVAFYATHDGLVNRWVHHYMDTPEDIAAFEDATGLVMDKIPAWGGETHPAKNSAKAIKDGAIVRLAKPIRIARETYTNKDGEPRHKLKRYVDSIGKPQTVTNGHTQAGQPGSTIAIVDKLPTASNQDLTIAAPDEKTWKQWVFAATKFLYTDVDGNYHDHKHRESLKKRMDSVGEYAILPTMTLYEVLNRVIRYRALMDLFIDGSDYPAVFGMGFEDYVQKHDHVSAWKRMNAYYLETMPSAKAKAANS
jgi:hypothetical protein